MPAKPLFSCLVVAVLTRIAGVEELVWNVEPGSEIDIPILVDQRSVEWAYGNVGRRTVEG